MDARDDVLWPERDFDDWNDPHIPEPLPVTEMPVIAFLDLSELPAVGNEDIITVRYAT